MKCPLLHENIQKETDTETETEKNICYDFMRFDDSRTVHNPLEAVNTKYPSLEPT